MSYLQNLNESYLFLHEAREEAFWGNNMGLNSYKEGSFEKAKIAMQQWSTNDNTLVQIQKELDNSSGLSIDEKIGLEGWKAFFKANVMEGEETKKLQKELVEMEGELQKKRSALKLGYICPEKGTFIEASYGKMGLLNSTSKNPALRKAANEGGREIGKFVLRNGFLEIVKKRNQMAKKLGYEDYYDYKLQVNEGFSKKYLFKIFDDLEENTRAVQKSNLEEVVKEHGKDAIKPWSIGFYTGGSIRAKADRYFSLENILLSWGKSFSKMGVEFSKATLTLDLFNRKGKFENGFMHGPYPSWVDCSDGKKHQPARVNFTANAIPGVVGAGWVALGTLFHEGGHAAHFSNIKMPSPSYGQEFAPTSAALAESQSMFFDNVIQNAEWMIRYGLDTSGKTIPFDLMSELLISDSKHHVRDLRSIMCVSYFEKMLYELPEKDLVPEIVEERALEIEQKFTQIDASPRSVLSVPHILEDESSAYYHSYGLALMGVFQMRSYFLKKYGFITDNPEIGRELKEIIWKKGNGLRFNEAMEALTGEPFSAKATIDVVNKKPEEIIQNAKSAVEEYSNNSKASEKFSFDAEIRMVHGDEVIGNCKAESDFSVLNETYKSWVIKKIKDSK